ncbi:hypothetical protein [Streptomyces sp.]|uniref:hypothetical protein n=1 Tax=Streptomyces sp. TaxID=1931 RepID=UPI002F40E86D
MRGPRPLRPRVLRTLALTATAALLVSGSARLVMTGHLLLPFERVTTLHARLASTADFFQDPQVARILLKHGVRVHTVSAGSREVATGNLDEYDFVFPSGGAAADMIIDDRQARHRHSSTFRPFDSPLVLASYREYAETLRDNGVATAQSAPDGGKPLYYWLDMDKFLRLTEQGRRWNDLGVGRHGVTNGDVVLAQTSDICQSNSAGTYLGLVAFTRNGDDVPTTAAQAEALARRIKPLLIRQGSPGADLFQYYASHDGRALAPVAVVYEHQYLAYQTRYRATHPTVDHERVLLYPRTQMPTQPQFIALAHRADALGRLLVTDPGLRRRATALGYRVLGPATTDDLAADGSTELTTYLRRHGVPAPDPTGGYETTARMPDLPLLERMIATVKECPATGVN